MVNFDLVNSDIRQKSIYEIFAAGKLCTLAVFPTFSWQVTDPLHR